MKSKVNSIKYKIVSRSFFFCILVSYFLLLTPFSTQAATPIYFKTIEKKPLKLFINTTNDIFLLQKGMLDRYNTDGTFFQNYGSIYINQRTEIISANGFKTILFSPDFGKIIQLDNRLKEIDVIDAYNLGTYIITCVGISYDNNYLWLFDAGSQRLIKIDKDKTPVFTSNTLSLLVGTNIKPHQIIESGITLYIIDLKNGIFIFDNQGNYIKNIPMEDAENVKVIDQIIYYTKDNNIYSYNNNSFLETQYRETPDLKQIQIGKTIICGVNKDGFVDIWKF